MDSVIQQRRHGDVLIRGYKGFKIPKEVKLKASKLIHKGANNAHVIEKGLVQMADAAGAAAPVGTGKIEKYLRVTRAATVAHVGGSSTHSTKPLPVGEYWTEIQTFYDHIAEEAKKVID